MGGLVERVEIGAPARPGQRLLGLDGCLRERREGNAATPAMAVALPQDPVVVEVRQQLTAGEIERRLGLAGVEEPVELAEVDGDVLAQLDPLAVGAERGGGRAERTANRRKRRPQARAGARVEHIGPERGRDRRPRVRPRVEREPGQQGASGAAGRQRKLAPRRGRARARRACARAASSRERTRASVAAHLRCVCGRPGHSTPRASNRQGRSPMATAITAAARRAGGRGVRRPRSHRRRRDDGDALLHRRRPARPVRRPRRGRGDAGRARRAGRRRRTLRARVAARPHGRRLPRAGGRPLGAPARARAGAGPRGRTSPSSAAATTSSAGCCPRSNA